MLAESLNFQNTETVHKIQADILWSAAQPLERAIALPQDAYTNAGFYDWEVTHIFKKQWFCVGHVAQVPQIGDYVALDLFGEPIVIIRDKRGEVIVLSRVCSHRGMDVLSLDSDNPSQGNCRRFVCPYHRWAYAIDGQLISAAEMQRHENWDRATQALPKFRSEIWQGLIFITFNPDLEPVSKQYTELQAFIERWNIAEMTVAEDVSWDYSFNWKVLVENFIEGYHHLGTHHQTLEPMIPAAGTWTEREKPNYIVCHLPFAKHVVEHIKAGNPMGPFSPPTGLNKIDAFEYTAYLGLPGFLLLVGPDRVYLYVMQPQGVDRLTVRTLMLVTPESTKMPNYHQLRQQEWEMFTRWFAEDMEICTAVQRGLGSQSYKPGPLSHLEMPIWLLQRYLARQIHESID